MTEIHIGVDVGGTFTDLALTIPAENRLILRKIASTPAQLDDAIVEITATALREHGLDPRAVVRLSHGTTAGTNALIERRVGKLAVVTTDGFRDLLEIGRQTRPKVYDIHSDHPKPLVPRRLRFEVPERRLADGSVFRALDEDAVRAVAEQLVCEDIDCVIVCFLHSYAFPEHEERAAEILRRALPDDVRVITSSSVYPEFREYERFSTAVLNGALITVMNDYLDRLTRRVAKLGIPVPPKICQSAGGLMSVEMARRAPIRASLSGPAAGVVAAARRARAAGYGSIVTLDMGGTSADVSLLVDGRAMEVQERLLAGFPLRLPALDVNAVGAGGGSIAWIDTDGLMKVGPRSAGAEPGPACYGLGGDEATVTDANVLLGRLNGEALLDGAMPIERHLAEQAVGALASHLGLDVETTALGIVRLACATMVKAIRAISLERGHNPAHFALFAFGGAGPLHAADVARDLEIDTVIVPPNPGILCADGAMNSELKFDFVRTVLRPLTDGAADALNAVRDDLLTRAETWFDAEGIQPEARRLVWSAALRYLHQNYELTIPLADARFDTRGCGALIDAFHRAHENHYGFDSEGETVQFANLMVKAVGELRHPPESRLSDRAPGEPVTRRETLFAGRAWHETPVYRRAELAPSQALRGPAIVEQLDTTMVVHPGDRCVVDEWGNLIVTLAKD